MVISVSGLVLGLLHEKNERASESLVLKTWSMDLLSRRHGLSSMAGLYSADILQMEDG